MSRPQRFEAFATPIWRFPADGSLDKAALEAAVLAERERDPEGVVVSNAGGWQSQNKLFREAAFQSLASYILQRAAAVLRDWGLELRGHAPVMNTLWANINGPGDTNNPHHHWGFPIPNFNVLSGVYYVRCNMQSGAIRFIDERPSTKFVTCYSLPVLAGANRFLGEFLTVQPAQGDLLFFPSWIEHKVTANEDQRERISMSFNLSLPQEVLEPGA